MNITIQKFGGTSTSSVPTRRMMYSHILEAISHQQKVVAVVSAMGRFDDPYATDTLYSLVAKLRWMTKSWIVLFTSEKISLP